MPPKKRFIRCEVCGHKVNGEKCAKRLFMARFPMDKDRCRQWVKAVGNEDLVHVPIERLHTLKYVCGNHFQSKAFNKKKTRLKKCAIPTRNLKTALPDEMLLEFPCHIHPTRVSQGTNNTKASQSHIEAIAGPSTSGSHMLGQQLTAQDSNDQLNTQGICQEVTQSRIEAIAGPSTSGSHMMGQQLTAQESSDQLNTQGITQGKEVTQSQIEAIAGPSTSGVEQALQLLSVEQQSTMSLETLCVKTEAEEAEVCEDDAGAHVKEEVECADSAALCELYADHQVKDELVLGPEEIHRRCVFFSVPGQTGLPGKNELAKTNKHQARVEEKKEEVKESTARRGSVEKLQDSTSPQVQSPMNTDILVQEVPPEKPAVNTFTGKTDSNATYFRCNQCIKGFDFKSDLEKHIQTHELLEKCKSRQASKDFTCKKCTCTFATKLLLLEHAKSRHDVKYFACSECEYVTRTKGSLQDHLRTHTGERPFNCSHCTSVFAHRGSLQSHLRTHTGEKPFKCSQCSFAFAQSDSLKTHLRTHTGEKPYKCNQCSSEFAQRGHLKTHLRTHTGEKPYKCNRCNSAFAESSGLKKHLRTHTGEKPFKCNMCEYEASQQGNLRHHLMSRHSGQKPYGCVTCSYRCATKQCLTRHIKKHHQSA